MLFEFLVFLFTHVCLLLILVVLIQKGSSSMGIGNIGGSNQLLFGGSGGQNIFQKITWVLGALFLGGSLVLAIMKTQQSRGSRYLSQFRPALPSSAVPRQAPALPAGMLAKQTPPSTQSPGEQPQPAPESQP